jgi:hypothetical protein
MPSPLIDTPQALDAAIAASRHARREKLVRAVRNQRIRTQVAFVLSAGVAIFSLVAFFFADDREAGARSPRTATNRDDGGRHQLRAARTKKWWMTVSMSFAPSGRSALALISA